MLADYTNSPNFQRMVQRLGRIRPEQRAIMNTLSVDAEFADENTRGMLRSLAQVQDKEYADKSFGLKEKAFDVSTGLRRQAFDEGVKQDRTATGIGIGQVAAETQFGLNRDAVDIETLKMKRAFLNRFPGGGV